MSKFMLTVGLCLTSLCGFVGHSRADEPQSTLIQASPSGDMTAPDDKSQAKDYGDAKNGNKGFTRQSDAIALREQFRKQGLAANIVTRKDRDGYFVRVFPRN